MCGIYVTQINANCCVGYAVPGLVVQRVGATMRALMQLAQQPAQASILIIIIITNYSTTFCYHGVCK